MNRPLLDKIVSAVLYDGYLLYPYRPAAKIRPRWTFGGLLPRSYCTTHDAEASTMRTECLVRGGPDTALHVETRFLHLLDRKIAVFDEPTDGPFDLDEAPAHFVDSYEWGDSLLQAWQEAVERDRKIAIGFDAPARGEVQIEVSDFEFPAHRHCEPIRDESGAIGAVVVRQQQTVAGALEVGIAPVANGLFKVRAQIENRTTFDDPDRKSRDDANLAALLSTHVILSVEHGEFLSMIDPPSECRGLAANLHNVGCWPVLVGDEGEHDTMLAAPIQLYDYPHVAPESPGDWFDGPVGRRVNAPCASCPTP